MPGFIVGVKDVDELLPSLLYPGSLVVVAGHPGSGKTTLASLICYRNALSGNRCLYISLQESKKKLFRVMKSLGMNFEELENKGLYRFLRVPIAKSVEEVAELISKAITEYAPKIVVVDSMNALTQFVSNSEKRALIQNYFYSLPEMIDGIVILIVELPFGEEKIDLGAIEFVADVILVLKHRIERGLLTRVMEIRKARGAPIVIAEIPFTISQDKGIIAYVPPILAEITRGGGELKLPCSALGRVLDHIHRGHVIYIEHPSSFRPLESVPLLLGIALKNNLKALIVSYRYPPETQLNLFIRAYSICGYSREDLRKIIEKYVVFKALNPFGYSSAEGVAEEIKLVEEYNADIVMFHGVELPAIADRISPNYLASLYNQMNTLKKMGKLIIRVGSYVNYEMSNLFSALADVVMKFIPTETCEGEQKYRVYIWRRGRNPYLLRYEDFQGCLKEVCEIINEKLKLQKQCLQPTVGGDCYGSV